MKSQPDDLFCVMNCSLMQIADHDYTRKKEKQQIIIFKMFLLF